MTIDRDALRRRIAGWKPKMTIEVEVQVLTALLDEFDQAVALQLELERRVFALEEAQKP